MGQDNPIIDPEIVQNFIKDYPKASIIIGTIIVIIRLLSKNKLTDIFELFERKEKQNIELLESYISSCNNVDNPLRKIIKDQNDTLYFKVVTGIYAEKRLRIGIIELHDIPNITWKLIRLALPYMEEVSNETKVSNEKKVSICEKVSRCFLPEKTNTVRVSLCEKVSRYFLSEKTNKTITVRVSLCEKGYRLYYLLISIIFIVLALSQAIKVIISQENTTMHLFTGFTISLLFVILAFVSLHQNRNVNAAMKIIKLMRQA